MQTVACPVGSEAVNSHSTRFASDRGAGEEADDAGNGNGVVTRADDVPEGTVLASGAGADTDGGPGTPPPQRAGGDRDASHHRRAHPADRGRVRRRARALEGVPAG